MASTHAWDNLTHDMREELNDLAHFSTIDANRQGRVALWATLTALPLVWGLDMLFGVMTDRWDGYLAVWALLGGKMNLRGQWEIGQEAAAKSGKELRGDIKRKTEEIKDGVPHVIWRRVGTHSSLNMQPGSTGKFQG